MARRRLAPAATPRRGGSRAFRCRGRPAAATRPQPRLLCAHTPPQPPQVVVVGVTAWAKLSAQLTSVTTSGTRPSAYPSTVTTTAQGTHTGKGPTRGIVGVASSRLRKAPSWTTTPAPTPHTTDRRPPSAPGRAGHEDNPARTTPQRPHAPARLRDWNSAAQARGRRPLPGARQSALTRASGEPARLRGRVVGACREHQRAGLWGWGRSVAAVAAFSRHAGSPSDAGRAFAARAAGSRAHQEVSVHGTY